MKNAIFATLALALICTAGAVAQDQNQENGMINRQPRTASKRQP
jgi:hypothetical protein